MVAANRARERAGSLLLPPRRERHWQGERNLSESNLRENWDPTTEDCAGVSDGGEEKASGLASLCFSLD